MKNGQLFGIGDHFKVIKKQVATGKKKLILLPVMLLCYPLLKHHLITLKKVRGIAKYTFSFLLSLFNYVTVRL